MKTTFFLLFFLSGYCFAQNGGMQIHLQKETSNCYWSNTKVYCHRVIVKDAQTEFELTDSASTDDFGWVIFNFLNAGTYQLSILEDSLQWSVADIRVQDKQLLVSEANLSATDISEVVQSNHPDFVAGKVNQEKTGTTITRQDIHHMPARSAALSESDDESSALQEVVITSYRLPLVNASGVSTYTIQKSDYSTAANTQNSPIAMTKTYLNATALNSVSIRGARLDANSYYVDGVRVSGIDVPNSMIGSVTIISGGIPANYGDVTGGVILVSTDGFGRPGYGNTNGIGMRGHRNTNVEEDPVVRFDRFSPIYENQFLGSVRNRHSTFGLDVDRASWTYCSRILQSGGFISRDAVKVEEFINSFPSAKIKVEKEEILHVEIQRLNCPWNAEHQLVAIHLKADDMKKEVQRIHHQFVFLLDVSGSMQGADRLELVKEGMKKLVASLDERDRVAIVTYAGYESVALPMTTCDQKNVIYNAIGALGASGSTNGMGGLQIAYDLALKNYDPQANNRVILATDGDFNVGISDPAELEEYIAQQRGKGIYLTALGVGMGNYRNDILETLADKGDGNHFYLQTVAQAEQVLVKEIGNLITVARDTKMDVQFNPEKVKSYRLLGYENRLMPSEHFRDDTKDGGEIGVNHQVVALYEIELGKDTTMTDRSTKDSLNVEADDLVAVRLRFKPMKEDTSVERGIHLKETAELEENPTLMLSAAFALELRNSPFKGTVNADLLKVLSDKKLDLPKELTDAVNGYLKNQF